MSTAGAKGLPLRAMAPKIVKQPVRRFIDWVGVRANRIEASWYDFKNKTDTTGSVNAKFLDVESEAGGHATGFQSVNEAHLRRVLDEVAFPDGSVFVDIGCGKGKAMLIAEPYSYVRKVVGVELAKSLCLTTEENIEIARARHGFTKPADVIHGNAVAMDYSEGENIFFLNNPFDADFMKIMIDVLERSVAKSPRKIWMLYGNPQHTRFIVQDGRFKFVRTFKFFGPGRNIAIFEMEPG